MTTPADRARYWDERILDWEASRYEGRWRPALGPAEWLAGRLSAPTRRRQALAVELAAPFLKGRRVVEAGCGTGLLARRFLDAGAGAYLGLDHAAAAIAAARRRHEGGDDRRRIRFEVRSAAELADDGDLVVSLGMLDWLTDDELASFFARHGKADFLHTFSERRGGLRQSAQRLLRALDAALRPDAVRPRFLALERVAGFLPAARSAKVFVLRDPGLRDAVFLSSLPVRGATPAAASGAAR